MTYANINRVYVAVQSLLNKQQLGFITPTQYNIFARIAQDIVFDAKIDALNGYVRTKQRHLETSGGSLLQRAEDELTPLLVYDEELQRKTFLTLRNVTGTFTVSETVGGVQSNAEAVVQSFSGTSLVVLGYGNPFENDELITGVSSSAVAEVASFRDEFLFPSDHAYTKEVSFNGNIADINSSRKSKLYSKGFFSPQNDVYPSVVMTSSNIKPNPFGLTEAAISYYRRPRGSKNGEPSAIYPQWAYTAVGENEVYNATNSYDFELPTVLEHELVMEIASLAGLNLRDEEAIKYAEGKKSQDNQIETPQ